MSNEKSPIELSLSERIIITLSEKPGLTAREIATALNVEKKDVNSALYGDLGSKCVQDEKYCWFKMKDAPKEKKIETTSSTTPLTNLCNYYLSCLSQDDESGVSTFADSKFDLDYVELESLPNQDNSSIFNTSDAQRLMGKIRKDRGKLEMYFGYPATLKHVRSKKSSWEGLFVEPILLFPVEISEGSPKISQGFPIFNLSVLKRFTNAEREQLMDELMLLEDELGLNSKDGLPELDDLAQRLQSIRPEWPWKEDVNPDDLSVEPALSEISEEGIYNRAVLILGERSPYIQGLESELKLLSATPKDEGGVTVLSQWVKGEIQKTKSDQSAPLLEVLPLNSEQREAILHSLSNPLTVITGPPGTGKSQVVTNLLINAAWQGKKVIFASKNNKAVDVVEVRVNNLGSRPILLRMGSGAYHTKLAEYLMGLLTSTSTEHDQEEFDLDQKRYKELEEQFKELDSEEEELIRLRNNTDQLDQSVEKIRGELLVSAFDKLKKADLGKMGLSTALLNKSLSRVIQEHQPFIVSLFWGLIKEGRYKEFSSKTQEFEQLAKQLSIKMPPIRIDEKSILLWNEFATDCQTSFQYAEYIQDYLESIRLLQKAKSLENISKEKSELMKKMADNASNLWKGWLRLQPSRLSSSDRLMLNQYNSLLRMVMEAGGDLYAKLGKKIYREYSNLSKQVSHLLPAWAITSLSVKGKIPFEPGYFDIVVFDEASQCDIASALPLLYRAKQAVIIGDPNQLSHISGLQKGQDQQLLEKNDLVPGYAHWAYSYNSLFDLASGLVSNSDIINLRDHHRSHADIIEFSNKEFYEGNLRVATNYDRLKLVVSEKNGVRWINVVGSVKRPPQGGAVNEIEARAVVDELKKLIIDRKYEGTIGVVTPFRAQANLIRKVINGDENLNAKLLAHEFLVDTVHKFQGDERDVMIFSPVVSKNMPKGGLLFMANNGNLFNVAITRARAALLVVGDLNATIQCKVSYLENFAKYAQEIADRSEKSISHKTKDLGEEYPAVSNPERVSDWEHILYKALYKAGLRPIPQYQVEKYTLDFALMDGKRMLNIEVDGETYHRNWTGELCRRDQIRNHRMFELGWDVKRFWVYEVRDDLDNCVAQIKEWLEQ